MPPPNPNITISLALDSDAPSLASVMTAAFSHSDAAYPLIWGKAAPGTHEMVAIKGLFSPVQKEYSITYKAIDEDNEGKLVGFATWNMPKPKPKEVEKEGKEGGGGGGLPNIPGVNTELWSEKVGGPRKFSERDVNRDEDMFLVFFFVHPDYQRRGIGSMLLDWGKRRSDELGSKIWLTSTPQARIVYERNGWVVVESFETDLGKFGGEGVYVRFWMMRVPGS